MLTGLRSRAVADFTLTNDGGRWWFEVPTPGGVKRGWRPTQAWAKRAARRHVPPIDVPCPDCHRPIDPLARRCPHCGEWLVGGDTMVEPAAPRPRATSAPTTDRRPPPPPAPRAGTSPPATPESQPESTRESPGRPPAAARSRRAGRVAEAGPDRRGRGRIGAALGPSRRSGPSPTCPRRRAIAPSATRHQRLTARRSAIPTLVAIPIIIVFALAVAGVGFVVLDPGTSTTPAGVSAGPTGTAPGEMASAAGKPCVALADPLPEGAPASDGMVGPPPTEVETEDLKEGTGSTVAATGVVTANYVGVACSTGKIFASSYTSGGPVAVPLDQVMPGWAKGVAGMKVGGVRLVKIPSAEAFAADGFPPLVAPDEAVWSVVEVTADTP